MGQEIFASYLEPFHTNLQRRAILLRGKSFECSCARCIDPLEFGTKASCYKCQVNCAGTGKGEKNLSKNDILDLLKLQ